MTLPPLPLPADRTRNSKGEWDNWYDAEQMERYAAAVRADALEEAAELCEDLIGLSESGPYKVCAAAIRELKEEK